jgi:hypothetical protein
VLQRVHSTGNCGRGVVRSRPRGPDPKSRLGDQHARHVDSACAPRRRRDHRSDHRRLVGRRRADQAGDAGAHDTGAHDTGADDQVADRRARADASADPDVGAARGRCAGRRRRADGAVPAEGPSATVTDPEQMPTNLRLRRLEQRVQALKERAWRAKARVGMLKEAVLGGGVGAQATLVHVNKMGTTFRLIKLVYALDGTQVFSRADDPATTLYKSKSIDILSGPIAPGSHTISVVAEYRGHGYGVFKYLTKYTFTVRSSHTFTIEEGKGSRIEAIAYEKGGATTPLEKRPNIDFKVSQVSGSGN